MLHLPTEYPHGDTMEDRLGRLINFDERNRQYPLTEGDPARLKLRPYTWRPGRVLDQIGGSCTFFTKGSELLARPSPVADHFVTDEMLLHGYHLAQHKDPWEGCVFGANCPIKPSSQQYEGSSVLAALQVLIEWGWAKEYRWVFNTPGAIHGIGHNGPAMTGSYWFADSMRPTPDGRIRPTGSTVGGHETMWYKAQLKFKDVSGPRRWANLDIDHSRVWNRQAWGLDWGLGGDAWMTVRDFATLQYSDGEVAFLVGRRSKPKPKR